MKDIPNFIASQKFGIIREIAGDITVTKQALDSSVQIEQEIMKPILKSMWRSRIFDENQTRNVLD